ncbi:MAG: arginine deiminase-related protein [Peptoniphilus sp.]|uniref:arginine deiminase-related protein n=1 Tax=Peptoniphilus sp. TaxID=1971214 RepID=UPI0025F9E3E4|nr:arginine deiminase-related protein [Peptoniphilus sp.]MCI5643862.1 arginine deiminase-related protein [Peptoniphilus sp.]MDY3902196.1 arginine deiminase-related protein [Peptoniphilus sp.]
MVTNRVILVRPYAFTFNKETARDNIYQISPKKTSEDEIKSFALREFDDAVSLLRKNKIHVDVIEDFDKTTPDSIFPNNVFVTFPGKVFVSEMYAENRNKEYDKILPQLKKIIDYNRAEVIDFRNEEGRVLEGTGAVVIDRWNNICYGSLSKRCNKDEFLKFAKRFNLKPVYFKSRDKGVDIYHTNVLMMVGEKFAIIADNLISENRDEVLKSLVDSGKEIISLTEDEFNNYAGNSIELKGEDKNILVISKSGFNALTDEHKKTIEKYDFILPIDVETISKYGGGSIRCMIAENFFDLREK